MSRKQVNLYQYFLSDIPIDIKFFQVDVSRMGTYFSKNVSRPGSRCAVTRSQIRAMRVNAK